MTSARPQGFRRGNEPLGEPQRKPSACAHLREGLYDAADPITRGEVPQSVGGDVASLEAG
jgi:hypothetical protein